MVHKSLNGLAPDYLCSTFADRGSVSTYSLRDSEGKLSVPLPRTEEAGKTHSKFANAQRDTTNLAINQATKKRHLPKFSYPKKSRNRKF